MDELIEKIISRRLFGLYFNDIFVQGDVTIKVLSSDNLNQSRRDDFYFLIDKKEYFSIEELKPIFKSELDDFLHKLQNILNT